MNAAKRALAMATLVVMALSPALAATPHGAHDRLHGAPAGYPVHAPVRITVRPARIPVYPGRIDFDRYIDPVSGMYCRNTGWAAVCVPPYAAYGLNCRPAWPFPVCTRF